MTTAFLIYLAKVSLSLALLTLLFKLALAADQSFARNRFYLLGALLWSAIIPSLSSQLLSNEGAATIITPTYTISIAELTASAANKTTDFSVWESASSILLTIYIAGALLVMLRSAFSYAHLLQIVYTAKTLTIDGCTIKTTKATATPFTFFGWIVFPEKEIGSSDFGKMLMHEQIHRKEMHSVDILLCELFCIVQWFNPCVWIMKRQIVENHEFTADKKVVDKGVDAYEYQISLVNATVGHPILPADNFSLLLTKKRIKMMNKKNSKWQIAKSILTPAAFVLALILTSFTVDFGVDKISDSNALANSSIMQNIVGSGNDESASDNKGYENIYTLDGNDANTDGDKYTNKKITFQAVVPNDNGDGSVVVQLVADKDKGISYFSTKKSPNSSQGKATIEINAQGNDLGSGKQRNKTLSMEFTMPEKNSSDTIKQSEAKIKINADNSNSSDKEPEIFINSKRCKMNLSEINEELNALDIASIDVNKTKEGTSIMITLKSGVEVPSSFVH